SLALNEADLLDRVAGDRELLQELVALFRADCPRMLGDVRAALASQDAAQLQRAAHALKGAVGNFGASAAWDTALHLEELGRGGRCPPGDSEDYKALEIQIDRLTRALTECA